MSEDYVTIRQYFKELLDNKDCRVIRFSPYGTMYGANPKSKKPARVSIQLPKEICNTNLKDLDNWVLVVVAIPRKTIEELPEEEE